MSTITIAYIDGHISVTPGGWTNTSNALDGSISTAATCDSGGGFQAIGSTYSLTASVIEQVRCRVYGKSAESGSLIIRDGAVDTLGNPPCSTVSGWGDWVTLSVPTGGWTNTKITQLRFLTSTTFDTTGDEINKVELEITTSATINNFWGVETGGLEEFSAVNGTVSLLAAYAHTGGYGFIISTATGSGWVELNPFESVASAGSGFVLGLWVKSSGSTGIENVQITDGTNQILRVQLAGTAAKISAYDANDTVITGLSSVGTAVDTTWSLVEIYFQNSASAAIEIFQDGTSIGSATAQDLDSGSALTTIRITRTANGVALIYDDIYFASGATSTDDRLGGCEVKGYRSTHNTATADLSALSTTALSTGVWSDAQQVPFNETNEIAWDTDAAAQGVLCDDLGGSSGGGPYTDTAITGSIVSQKGIWRSKRGNGGSTSFNFYMGADVSTGSGWSPAPAYTVTDLLTTSYANYFLVSNDVAYLPQAADSEYCGIGAQRSGARDLFIADMLNTVLHVPPDTTTIESDADATGSATVTGYSEALKKTTASAAGSTTATMYSSATVPSVGTAVVEYLETATYYVDASDNGPSDPGGVWTNEANAFDGSTSTYAETGQHIGTDDALEGGGTNAPITGNTITQVRARAYTSRQSTNTAHYTDWYTDGLGEFLGRNITGTAGSVPGWTSYVTLTTPTGGWTWQKVNDLEVQIWQFQATNWCRQYAQEVEVTYDAPAVEGQTAIVKTGEFDTTSAATVTGQTETLIAASMVNIDTIDITVDGSTSITDPDSAWTNDANAADGSTSTYAYTNTAGTLFTNELNVEGVGSTLPTGAFKSARGRLYGSATGTSAGSQASFVRPGSGTYWSATCVSSTPGWSNYVTLIDWGAWSHVQGGKAVIQGLGSPLTEARAYWIQIEVTYDADDGWATVNGQSARIISAVGSSDGTSTVTVNTSATAQTDADSAGTTTVTGVGEAVQGQAEATAIGTATVTGNAAAINTSDANAAGSCGEASNAGLLTGLISWWDMDETTGNRIDSHGSNTLVPSASVSYTTGLNGNAASLAGATADVLTCSSPTSIDGSKTVPYCMLVFVYPTAWLSGHPFLITQANGANYWDYNWSLHRNSNSPLDWYFTVYETNGTAHAVQGATFGNAQLNQWQMVYGEFDPDNNTIGIAVNGGALDTQDASSYKSLLNELGNIPVRIGAWSGRNPDGNFDTTAFWWNRTLSQTERQAIWNNGAGLDYTGLTSGGITWDSATVTTNAYTVTDSQATTSFDTALVSQADTTVSAFATVDINAAKIWTAQGTSDSTSTINFVSGADVQTTATSDGISSTLAYSVATWNAVAQAIAEATTSADSGLLYQTIASAIGLSTVTGYTTATYEFEAFRFRNDNGTESTATWKSGQDANISENINVIVRLRTLIDTTGSPDSAQVTLQYRKVGEPDTDWRNV